MKTSMETLRFHPTRLSDDDLQWLREGCEQFLIPQCGTAGEWFFQALDCEDDRRVLERDRPSADPIEPMLARLDAGKWTAMELTTALVAFDVLQREASSRGREVAAALLCEVRTMLILWASAKVRTLDRKPKGRNQ